eukprot:819416-Prymnesium_polylepis.1
MLAGTTLHLAALGAFKAALPLTAEEWTASQSKVPALLALVKPEHRARCENVLRGKDGRGWSQAWQDWMIYRNFFAGQTQGVYLDIGTNEALTISNTAFFDLCLGWQGICFEPQSQYHAEIRNQRKCKLVPQCVMGRRTTVAVEGGAGHSAKFSTAATAAASTATRRTCVGVLDEIANARFHSTTIDLISIDIEGAEPYVLSCFPWDRLHVRLVLIETNHLNQREVDAFFSKIGYANVATMLQTDGSFLDNLYMRLPGGPLAHPGVVGRCSDADRALNHCNAAGDGTLHWRKGGEWQAWPNATSNRMSNQYKKYGYGRVELSKWQCAHL